MILKDSEEYVDLQRSKEIQRLVLEFRHHSLCTQEHYLDRHGLLHPLLGNKTVRDSVSDRVQWLLSNRLGKVLSQASTVQESVCNIGLVQFVYSLGNFVNLQKQDTIKEV
jgi:hypothetical protein